MENHINLQHVPIFSYQENRQKATMTPFNVIIHLFKYTILLRLIFVKLLLSECNLQLENYSHELFIRLYFYYFGNYISNRLMGIINKIDSILEILR